MVSVSKHEGRSEERKKRENPAETRQQMLKDIYKIRTNNAKHFSCSLVRLPLISPHVVRYLRWKVRLIILCKDGDKQGLVSSFLEPSLSETRSHTHRRFCVCMCVCFGSLFVSSAQSHLPLDFCTSVPLRCHRFVLPSTSYTDRSSKIVFQRVRRQSFFLSILLKVKYMRLPLTRSKEKVKPQRH